MTDLQGVVIGLVGGAGSGKDTLASMIQDLTKARTTAIADELRALTSRLYHLSPGHFDRDLKDVAIPHLGRSPRDLLCSVGDALGDTFGDLFLIARVMEQVHLELHKGHQAPFVITDVRYEHEAAEIRAWGEQVTGIRAFLVRISGRNPGYHAHRSEQQWDKVAVDLEVDNTGDLDDLRRQAEYLVNLARAVPRN